MRSETRPTPQDVNHAPRLALCADTRSRSVHAKRMLTCQSLLPLIFLQTYHLSMHMHDICTDIYMQLYVSTRTANLLRGDPLLSTALVCHLCSKAFRGLPDPNREIGVDLENAPPYTHTHMHTTCVRLGLQKKIYLDEYRCASKDRTSKLLLSEEPTRVPTLSLVSLSQLCACRDGSLYPFLCEWTHAGGSSLLSQSPHPTI